MDGKADFLILPSMQILEMEIFLKEVSTRHFNEIVLMFMDQAPSHKGLKIPENIIIKNIPSYCPQLNPAENIWEEMREKHFANLAFDSMNSIEDKLVEACLAMEANHEKIQSITGFNWILVDL